MAAVMRGVRMSRSPSSIGLDLATPEGPDVLHRMAATCDVRLGDEAPDALRAPEFKEHADEVLESIGLDVDAIIDLKVKGVVA